MDALICLPYEEAIDILRYLSRSNLLVQKHQRMLQNNPENSNCQANIYQNIIYFHFNIQMGNRILVPVIAISVFSIVSVFDTLDNTSLQRQLFELWKSHLKLQFQENEEIYRFKVFLQNIQKINTHNSKLSRGHYEGLNQFVFLTHKEFSAQYLSEIQIPNTKIEKVPILSDKTLISSAFVDWVAFGAVTPVKNQGSCLSSYAFSAVGAIEGISAIYYQALQQYSVQQIVDCSQAYGNNGCSTGNVANVFRYVLDKGINTQDSYPYIGRAQGCKVTSGPFKISGFVNTNDCNDLADALVIQPVSVAVDGNNFQFYKSGVFYNCGTNPNLPLLLVGMDFGFWQLKNAWGTSWGQGGYIRIARGNTCRVCQFGSYPKL